MSQPAKKTAPAVSLPEPNGNFYQITDCLKRSRNAQS